MYFLFFLVFCVILFLFCCQLICKTEKHLVIRDLEYLQIICKNPGSSVTNIQKQHCHFPLQKAHTIKYLFYVMGYAILCDIICNSQKTSQTKTNDTLATIVLHTFACTAVFKNIVKITDTPMEPSSSCDSLLL